MNKYSIRRTSLISPWGVGAIVPFPHDESLMVAGLDFWFDDDCSYKDFIIVDERLSKFLNGKILVAPPDFREKKHDKEHFNMRIQAVRFPQWHYCPVCGNMEKLGSAGDRKRCSGAIRKQGVEETSCSKKAENKKPFLVPERFVTVCKNGHIDDFPIMEWVHRKSNKDFHEGQCKLRRSTGTNSSSLSGVQYTCTCGATANMSGAFGWDALGKINYKCRGRRPWLGEYANEECDEPLIVLQRGASNVWFSEILSSVYIPWLAKEINAETKNCIEKGTKKFTSSRSNGDIDRVSIRNFVCMAKDYDESIDIEEAYNGIEANILGNTSDSDAKSDMEYKKQEFDVLTRSAGKPESELYVQNFKGDLYEDLDFLQSISLVHKLRETRAFIGFRRISPEDSKIAKISLEELPWLPAIKNSGEGIMFEFELNKLEEWLTRKNVSNRIKIIEANLLRAGKLDKEKINPIYVLLHTFSHCIINTLSKASGYSNASIRERLYCNKYIADDKTDMAGVLIYTASGDSEGSLGGLVRQGTPGRIEQIIKRAIIEAGWCASDPVCIQSNGQGQAGGNLAACHNCTLLPETSCENQNLLLDRGLMIGTLSDKAMGYFNEYKKS